jgi:hypothetical protein
MVKRSRPHEGVSRLLECRVLATVFLLTLLVHPGQARAEPCVNTDDNVHQTNVCIDTFRLVEEPKPPLSPYTFNMPTVTLYAHWYVLGGLGNFNSNYGNPQFNVGWSITNFGTPVAQQGEVGIRADTGGGSQIAADSRLHHALNAGNVAGSPFGVWVQLCGSSVPSCDGPLAVATLSPPAPPSRPSIAGPPPFCVNGTVNVQQSGVCIDTFRKVAEPAPPGGNANNDPTVTLYTHFYLISGNLHYFSGFVVEFSVTTLNQAVPQPDIPVGSFENGGQISQDAKLFRVTDVWGVTGPPFGVSVTPGNYYTAPLNLGTATATLSEPPPPCPSGTVRKNGVCQ